MIIITDEKILINCSSKENEIKIKKVISKHEKSLSKIQKALKSMSEK